MNKTRWATCMNIYVFMEGKAGKRPIVSASERLFMSLSKGVPGVLWRSRSQIEGRGGMGPRRN